MADKTFLTICLRKEVESIDQAKTLIGIVKDKLADQPTVIISNSISTVVDIEEPS